MCGIFAAPWISRTPVLGIETRDGAAGLQRRAAVPADRERQLDHEMRRREGSVDVAIALADDRRLGGQAVVEDDPAARSGSRCGRQVFDVGEDQSGRVLGKVGILGKDHGDRLADIADLGGRQHRLAIRPEAGYADLAEVDRRDVRDVGRCPRRRPRRAAPAPPPRRYRGVRPCATGERTTRMWSWPGKLMSAAKRPCPVRSGPSSSRRTERPMTRHHRIFSAAARTALRMFW